MSWHRTETGRPDERPGWEASLGAYEEEIVAIIVEENGHLMESLPISLVPTPTREYREHRKRVQTLAQPGTPVIPSIPLPLPLPGARVLIWKQDPAVAEIDVRKAYLPGHIFQGPKDARIASANVGPNTLPAVGPNAFGDLIQVPGTDAFDAVQTFAVARMTLTMYQRARAAGGTAAPLPWQWNSGTNADPLTIFPHGLPEEQNAFYERQTKSLRFGHFSRQGSNPPQRVFTCRSLDIVAHETGHAVLDGLKPNWLLSSNPPQTGGLHESFGDLTAIFLALSQLDQIEAVIAQTKANLHDKTFLADLAEEFGLALGRPNGLRNADNDLKLSQVGNEVHAISQVFTGAIYDILADIFAFEQQPAIRDDAVTLLQAGQYVMSLVLRALIGAPATAATYADVANQMLQIAAADGKPAEYRTFIRNRFTVREVVVASTPLTETLDANITDDPDAVQNRSTCCGTMKLPEYNGAEEVLEAEREDLRAYLAKMEKVDKMVRS
jgi:hypothetical protein